MTDFFGRRVGNSLVPEGEESIAEFSTVQFGATFHVALKQPRNIGHHKLFFALCARIGRGIGKNTEWVERAFKVECGLFDIYKYRGRESMVLRSIAFHKMDQLAFREFFEQCVQIMYERWKIDPASVADLLVPQEEQKRD